MDSRRFQELGGEFNGCPSRNTWGVRYYRVSVEVSLVIPLCDKVICGFKVCQELGVQRKGSHCSVKEQVRRGILHKLHVREPGNPVM